MHKHRHMSTCVAISAGVGYSERVTDKQLERKIAAVAKRVCKAREAAGLSQRELAEAIGSHQPQVWLWERKGCGQLRSLLRIADACGVTVAQLVGEAEL